MPCKHRVNEGFMECSDCHNPHGAFAPTWRMSERPRMVDQALNNEDRLPEMPCGQARAVCHMSTRRRASKAAKSVTFPTARPMSACFGGPVVFTLCLGCHNGGASGTRNNGVPIQTSQHNLLDPRYQRCTTCHVRIHGSNTDETFLR